MEMPSPTNEHRRLEKLVGRFHGNETVHPSAWSEDEVRAESTTEARVILDGFAIAQEYEQRQLDGDIYRGHGVFRYDSPSDTYELHWFDSTGEPLNLFRGGFEGKVLTLTSRRGDGWMRLVYDFNLAKGYRLRMETSEDGDRWEAINQGEHLFAPRAEGGSRTGARRTTGAKATAKKAASRKRTTNKATARKAAARKTTARKKPTAKKATATKKAAARKKTTAKQKTTAKKKAAAKKKATAKKATAKKKAGAGKGSTRKAAAKGKKATTSRRASSGATAGARKTAPAGRVPASEKRRRSQAASATASGGRRSTTRPLGASAKAAGSGVEKGSKSSARKKPPMPSVHKTSTRVGEGNVAARGNRRQL